MLTLLKLELFYSEHNPRVTQGRVEYFSRTAHQSGKVAIRH